MGLLAFETTPENLNRWRSWWKFANIEQLATFVLITFLSIFFTSLLAYSTVFGAEGLPDDIGFLEVEGNALKDSVAPWFGTFFWVIGAFSLFAAALGIVDYTCRLVADVIKTSYAREANESKLYFGLVWAIVVIGIIELLIGIDQPLVLIVISACVGGLMMFMYSGLLILTNRNILSGELRIGGFRLAVMVWSIALFGTLSVLVIIQQYRDVTG